MKTFMDIIPQNLSPDQRKAIVLFVENLANHIWAIHPDADDCHLPDDPFIPPFPLNSDPKDNDDDYPF